MKTKTKTLGIVLLSPAVYAAPLPPSPPPSGLASVGSSYIIQLKPTADYNSSVASITDLYARNSQSGGESTASTSCNGIHTKYENGPFFGYAGCFDNQTVESIRNSCDVVMVEEDQIWSIGALVTEDPSTWGLATISHNSPDFTDYVYDDSAGSGTYIYVVDSGVNIDHVEFEGRASNGYSAAGGDFTDTVGHGTHVAGTVASKTYGVSKNASIISVKVLSGDSGSSSMVLDGYGWAVNDIIAKNRTSKAVINMSLGGGYSAAFNSAIQTAYNLGVVTVVAAGNDASDASTGSPGSAPEAITVAAIDESWTIASFSNFGSVVDLFAPGVNVLSTFIGSNNATKMLSGTSMASPHVAGLALYLMGQNEFDSAETVADAIVSIATKGAVNDPKGSPNLIAFNGNTMPNGKAEMTGNSSTSTSSSQGSAAQDPCNTVAVGNTPLTGNITAPSNATVSGGTTPGSNSTVEFNTTTPGSNTTSNSTNTRIPTPLATLPASNTTSNSTNSVSPTLLPALNTTPSGSPSNNGFTWPASNTTSNSTNTTTPVPAPALNNTGSSIPYGIGFTLPASNTSNSTNSTTPKFTLPASNTTNNGTSTALPLPTLPASNTTNNINSSSAPIPLPTLLTSNSTSNSTNSTAPKFTLPASNTTNTTNSSDTALPMPTFPASNTTTPSNNSTAGLISTPTPKTTSGSISNSTTNGNSTTNSGTATTDSTSEGRTSWYWEMVGWSGRRSMRFR